MGWHNANTHIDLAWLAWLGAHQARTRARERARARRYVSTQPGLLAPRPPPPPPVWPIHTPSIHPSIPSIPCLPSDRPPSSPRATLFGLVVDIWRNLEGRRWSAAIGLGTGVRRSPIAPALNPGRRDELGEAMTIANHEDAVLGWNRQGAVEQALFAQPGEGGGLNHSWRQHPHT